MTQSCLSAAFDTFLCKNIIMQYIILKLRSSTVNILILFLPEFTAVLMTTQNMPIYGPINIVLI